jgi:multisubunit Na+/H+ antiporter MnhG subunit
LIKSAILSEIKNIKSGKKELREFGLTIGVIFIILAGIALWRGRGVYIYLGSLGIIFIGFGIFLPSALKPLQKAWMAFSACIGFFMSRLVLMILFYGVMTPIGLAAKILGKDLLDERIEKDKASYWREIDNAARTRESYENQY